MTMRGLGDAPSLEYMSTTRVVPKRIRSFTKHLMSKTEHHADCPQHHPGKVLSHNGRIHVSKNKWVGETRR